jgi:sialidase-1
VAPISVFGVKLNCQITMAKKIESSPCFSRRMFLSQSIAASAAWAPLASSMVRSAAKPTPSIRVLETKIISHQLKLYHGWPTLTQRQNGELWLVWSGGREDHVCPFGQVHSMTSKDNGENWTWPRVLLDGPIDDRDAGVLETAKGTLLVTTFTSLAYVPLLQKAEKSGEWPVEKLRRWQAVHCRLSPEAQQKELGQWMLRSTDGGITWSRRFDSIVNSPHGPIQLRDGRLLYAGKMLWTNDRLVGVCESKDDGETWRWLASIPIRPGDDVTNYHELHAVEAKDGTILVHIRNQNVADNRETLQSESMNAGKTWSQPHSIGVWGLPSYLLRLRDGLIVMTYGHRRAPLGNQVRLSDDNGQTWSDAMMISADGTSTDLGYPSTVQLQDGSFLTVWYELMKSHPKAVLRQARWRLT